MMTGKEWTVSLATRFLQDVLHNRPEEADMGNSELEESVLLLVRDTIGEPVIRLSDNFFAAGGHSLLSTKFNLRVRERFGVKLTLKNLFEAETIADIAAQIEELVLQDILAISEEDAERMAAQEIS